MKKVILIVICSALLNTLSASSFAFSVVPVHEFEKPLTASSLRADYIVQLSAKEFGRVTGKKLKIKEKVSFAYSK